MKKLLTALIAFFILGLIIVATVRGISAIRAARTVHQTPTSSGGGNSSGGGFVSSVKDTLWSPISILTGSGSPSGALPFFITEVKTPGLSDSFESREDWERFASSTSPDDDIPVSPSDGVFDMSSYYGPTTTTEAQHFGEPSRLRGKVRIMTDEISLGGFGDDTQYLTLQAATGIRDPISITGWTLQNMRTGQRIPIPHAVRIPKTGQTGKLQEITLLSGERAVISSQVSPLGTSFKENICSGYLDQFQKFTPEFEDHCPLPIDELEATQVSTALGEECRTFVGFVAQCEFYKGEVPEGVSTDCMSFVKNHLSYNGCVSSHQTEVGFIRPVWRVFIGKVNFLEAKDTVRLLDKEGRTVDAVTL